MNDNNVRSSTRRLRTNLHAGGLRPVTVVFSGTTSSASSLGALSSACTSAGGTNFTVSGDSNGGYDYSCTK